MSGKVINVYDNIEMPPEPQVESVEWICPNCDRKNEDELNFAHGDCISNCTCSAQVVISSDHQVFSSESSKRKY